MAAQVNPLSLSGSPRQEEGALKRNARNSDGDGASEALSVSTVFRARSLGSRGVWPTKLEGVDANGKKGNTHKLLIHTDKPAFEHGQTPFQKALLFYGPQTLDPNSKDFVP